MMTGPEQDDGVHLERVGPLDPGAADRSDVPRLVLAHGFTQNGRCWGRFGQLLARQHETVRIDAPGHGRSPAHHDNADLWRSAELLTDAGGRGIYIGYSMGGRTALHAALARPDLVRGLVLIGATPGLVDAGDRADRRRADAALAERLLAEGLAGFLDRWLAGPLFAGLDDEQAAKQQRLENRPDGLAASLHNCGTGAQEPLWERLPELTMPVLIVVGDRDEKFSAIGRRMAEAINSTGTVAGAEAITSAGAMTSAVAMTSAGAMSSAGAMTSAGAMSSAGARVLSLPGTHAVHLEQPAATAEAVLASIANW